MDGIWLKASKRIEDFALVKERLTRQWNVFKQRLLEDIPSDLSKTFNSRSALAKRRLFNSAEKILSTFNARWGVIKSNSTRFSDYSISLLQNRWLQLQPRLDNLVQTSFAISTATSTLHLTVQITPILLSALTIMATAPMLNAILPEFLFNSTVLFFIMMAISAYAGYSKFKELETRAKLDAQIETTEKENERQRSQIAALQIRLDQLESTLMPATGSSLVFSPLAQLGRQHRHKSSPHTPSPKAKPVATRQDTALKR